MPGTIGPMSSVRIALCQIDAVVGDVAGNVARVLDALDVAEAAGADLAVFPELVLTGYPPEDLLLKPSFVAASMDALETVAQATRRCAAAVGFAEAGRDLHNAVALCSGGVVAGVARKELLPNYGVFDERRWFVPGPSSSSLFLVGGVRVGIVICEDAWSPVGPLARLAAGGAELVVICNASPYRAGAAAEREKMLATRAVDSSCALAYVNLVGGQDELVFDGASMVVDASGEVVASAAQFAEQTIVCDLQLRPSYRSRLLEPRGHPQVPPLPVTVVSERHDDRAPGRFVGAVAPRLGRVEEVYSALVLGTRDYVVKSGFTDVVVGLSGGVDSALVATIAVDALGAGHVHGVAMPSRFSSAGSLDDASLVAANLGITLDRIDIETAHAAFLDLLAPAFGDRPPGLAEENLQARIRGTLLMALSNKLGWLVLTTGNKSETAVGYSTLYGDMAGGFAVVKDVPKTLVYELCAARNARAGRDLVPGSVLSKPPSAELRPDQRDEDSLPPYAVLDPILEGYVERDLSVADLVELGHDEATVRRVVALVDGSEYKRRQGPPGVRVTSRAFGKDRRMPITNAYRDGDRGADGRSRSTGPSSPRGAVQP
jgi:NAD+ synthase (glutamine-hydrolysing)